ncbi:Uncharacterised protein [uncultured archaeon]|nr:Uncharacterised protein [uncultured archaeon]
MLALFSLLSGIDVNYKKVERLCSNYDVSMAIYNLHMLILKTKGVKKIDAYRRWDRIFINDKKALCL